MAFIQNGGTISQSLNFAAGTYALSMQIAQRNGQQQAISVSVDGTVVGTVTPATVTFYAWISPSFTVTAGQHTLTLTGTNISGDNTAFVDSVAVVTPPPPPPPGTKPVSAYGPFAEPQLLTPPDYMPWNGSLPHNTVTPFPYVFSPPYSSGKQTSDPTLWTTWYQDPLVCFPDAYGDATVPFFNSDGSCGSWFHQDPITAEYAAGAFAGFNLAIDRAGGRGDYYVSPLATYCVSSMDAEQSKCLTGIDVFGCLYGIDDGDGSRKIFVPRGTFSHPTDICVDPRQPATAAQPIHYVADGGNNRVAKVDLSTTPPTITTYVSGLSNPTSIAMGNDGTLYVANHDADQIVTVSPTGTQSVIPLSQPIYEPFCLRLTSKGMLVVTSDLNGYNGIWCVNPSTGAVVQIVKTGTYPTTAPTDRTNRNWLWLDVDRNGSCGAVDDILFTISVQSSGMSAWTLANGGAINMNNVSNIYNALILRVDLAATRLSAVGPCVNSIFRSTPHYPWVLTIHPYEAKFYTGGFGQFCGLVLNRPMTASDPVYGTPTGGGAPNPTLAWELDNATKEGVLLAQGRQIMLTGTSLNTATAVSGRPPLANVLGLWGVQFVGGKTFDEMALGWTFAQFSAFIQSGAGGAVKRPEIAGNDLLILWYYVQRYSLKGWQTTIPMPTLS